MGQMLFGALVQQNGLGVMDQTHQRMHKCPPPGRRLQTFSQENATMGEIEAAMPSSHRHVLGRQLFCAQAVGAQLQRAAQGQLAQLCSHENLVG
jgi:hypothetical protein